jgi:hypothetical protein
MEMAPVPMKRAMADRGPTSAQYARVDITPMEGLKFHRKRKAAANRRKMGWLAIPAPAL